MTYVDRIVKAFGGIRPMATAIGKTPSTVQSWKARGSIPDEHKLLIWNTACEKKVPLTAEHFLPFDSDQEAAE